MARPEKEGAVREIAARFADADAALLTEYRGLKVRDIAEVRGALSSVDAEYKVLKNTLARIAAREAGLESLVNMLEGPTAIAFIKGDAAAAAKALDDAAKKFPFLVIKGGVLSGNVISPEQARALAELEPRDVLLSKMAMLLNSQAQQAVNVLGALLRNCGSMLAQVLEQKQAGEPPAPEAESAPAAPAEAESAPAAPAEAAPAAPAEAEPPAEAGALTEAPGAVTADLPEAQEQSEAAPESDAAANEEIGGSTAEKEV